LAITRFSAIVAYSCLAFSVPVKVAANVSNRLASSPTRADRSGSTVLAFAWSIAVFSRPSAAWATSASESLPVRT